MSKVIRSTAVAFAAALLFTGCIEQPPTTTTPAPVLPAPGSCFESSNPNQADFLYLGPIDQRGNAMLVDSLDGTCSGGPFGGSADGAKRTWVHATSLEAATVVCDSLSAGATATNEVNSIYLGVPDDIWRCSILGV